MIGRLREIADRIMAFLKVRGGEDDLEEEMSAHLDLSVAGRIVRPVNGLRRRAKGGSVEDVKPRLHRPGGGARASRVAESRIVASRLQLRVSRGLRKNPGFTTVVYRRPSLRLASVSMRPYSPVTKAAPFAGFPMVAGNDRILYLSSSRGCCVSYPDFLTLASTGAVFPGDGDCSGNHGNPQRRHQRSGELRCD